MSSRPHPGSERPLHGPVQRFDLEAEVGRLREEGAWHRGQRNSITLRKGEGMNVVLVVMKAGERLEEHAAPGPLSLSVREGRIRFMVAKRWRTPERRRWRTRALFSSADTRDPPPLLPT